MAAADTENVTEAVNSLQINGVKDTEDNETVTDEYVNKWGFDLPELYKLALRFYKEKEGKAALHVTYRDRVKLVAYTKQVSYGKYRADVSPEVGFLDVVGNDRRQAWQQLTDMTQEQAMAEFVKYLDSLCPLFKPYMQAHKAEKEEQELKRKEEEERIKKEEEVERLKLQQEAQFSQDRDRLKHKEQEMQIRAALNQQTAIQFRQYAEQQYPGNNEQQEVLILQLQEQHFQQYMQQVYQQQLLHQQQQYQQLQAMQNQENPDGDPQANHSPAQPNNAGPGVPGGPGASVVGAVALPQQQGGTDVVVQGSVAELADGNPLLQSSMANANSIVANALEQGQQGEEDDDDDNDTDQNDLPPISAASMWTRKDIKEFKDSLRNEPDSSIKVGSGETVTVRVPTHEDGTCLFWEFATDSYDLGFGVYFEWTIAPSNQVSVHVSESSDEEEGEDEEGGDKGDIEKGSSPKTDNSPPTDEIIPVYRRDCHGEVYCGSHMYPGRGVYLLKFDNSYSLWRSKTLYYRVYYTR